MDGQNSFGPLPPQPNSGDPNTGPINNSQPPAPQPAPHPLPADPWQAAPAPPTPAPAPVWDTQPTPAPGIQPSPTPQPTPAPLPTPVTPPPQPNPYQAPAPVQAVPPDPTYRDITLPTPAPTQQQQPVQAQAPAPQQPAKKKSKLIMVIAAVAGLLIIAGGLFFLLGSHSTYSTKTLVNGGFTYNFKFYTKAVKTTAGGENRYSYLGKTIADVQPTDEKQVTNCADLGSKWKQAFSIQLNGAQLPVCTATSSGLQAFDLIFPALNKNHLFLITYDGSGSPPTNSTLESFFESVQVSK